MLRSQALATAAMLVVSCTLFDRPILLTATAMHVVTVHLTCSSLARIRCELDACIVMMT